MIKLFGKEFVDRKISCSDRKVFAYGIFTIIVHPESHYYFMCSTFSENEQFGLKDAFTIVSSGITGDYKEELESSKFFLLEKIRHHQDVNSAFRQAKRFLLTYEIPKDALDDLIGNYVHLI